MILCNKSSPDWSSVDRVFSYDLCYFLLRDKLCVLTL